MAIYRICFRGLDESFAGEKQVWCSVDEDAVTAARESLLDHAAVEVWCGKRFVTRVSRPSACAGSADLPN